MKDDNLRTSRLQSWEYVSVGYKWLSEFATNIKHHPSVPQPVKKIIMVSQTGFDDSTRTRKYEIEESEGIKVELITPVEMLQL
jgi:hypothetical protein